MVHIRQMSIVKKVTECDYLETAAFFNGAEFSVPSYIYFFMFFFSNADTSPIVHTGKIKRGESFFFS